MAYTIVMHDGYLFTCHWCNKKLFRTRKHAKRHAQKVHPDHANELKAYECPIHSGWHYGSLPPGGRKQARRALRRRLKDDGELE